MAEATQVISAESINALLFAKYGVKFVANGIQLGSDLTGWQVRHSVAGDIPDDAHAVGNLIVIDLESNTKREFEK